MARPAPYGPYASDRWITPGVIIAGILTAGLVVSVVAAGVTYLAARDVDPEPMLRLVAEVAGACALLGNLLLTLTQRTTLAKTERNTGVLAGAVAEVAAPAPAPDLAALQSEAPARPAYVVNLDDDDDPATAYGERIPVPAVPPLPRHLHRRRSDAP